MRPDPSGWTPTRLRLIGTHAGHLDTVPPGREKLYGYAREILIGHHLRLLAEDYADLRDLIYGEWPALKDWPLH